MTRCLRVSPLLIVGLCASSAFAHERLIAPPPRADMEANQKVMPCGGLPRSAAPTQVQPGAKVTLQWTDTIYHPGWFRISFRATEGEDFAKTVLMDKIAVKQAPLADVNYTQDVQLPTTACTDCTLQLIYVMTDQPDTTNTFASGYREYTACADIVVGAAAATTGGTTTGSTGGTTPGATGDGTTTGGNAAGSAGATTGGTEPSTAANPTEAPHDNIGGCAAATPTLWVMAALGASVALRRRRSTAR